MASAPAPAQWPAFGATHITDPTCYNAFHQNESCIAHSNLGNVDEAVNAARYQPPSSDIGHGVVSSVPPVLLSPGVCHVRDDMVVRDNVGNNVTGVFHDVVYDKQLSQSLGVASTTRSWSNTSKATERLLFKIAHQQYELTKHGL